MHIPNIMNGEITVTLVDTPRQLAELSEYLLTLKELAFDTEFDRFYRQYGFNLQLIQIFDGRACFLVDAVQIKSLEPLWEVFENERITKVLFSGREDVDLLKRNGCNTTNLLDAQIAAFLCNKPEQSYSNLLKNEFGIELDKSAQRSNWETRPLTISQLIYASNDVMHLLRLKDLLIEECREKKVMHFLEEENLILAASKTTDYAPKLTPKQKKEFSDYSRQKLMEFKLLTDHFGKELNKPPHNIVSDSILEDIIKDKQFFLNNPFSKGFNKTIVEIGKFASQFIGIVHSIDPAIPWKNKSTTRPISQNPVTDNRKARPGKDPRFHAFREFVVGRHGEIASSLILGGLAERFKNEDIDWSGAKKYQLPLYEEFLRG